MCQNYLDILRAYLEDLNHGELSGAFWNLVNRSIRTMTVQRGAQLCSELNVPSHCWFVACGLAMEYIYDDMGQKVPLRFFHREAFIPFGFLEKQCGRTTCEMITNGTVFATSYRQLTDLWNLQPEAHRLFHLALSDYAQRGRLREQILILAAEDRIRYVHEKHPELILTISAKDLAHYLNMSQPTYSRLKNRIFN